MLPSPEDEEWDEEEAKSAHYLEPEKKWKEALIQLAISHAHFCRNFEYNFHWFANYIWEDFF